ncbi:DHHC-type zinc finger family protein [Striga asiatica]|uniref:DHHC-type zinc finger family protein n=1 Tax=Striga asiatica TaxID=4170 RepID=A0A5A7P3J5_STRAF|nr:DHHC-type zinc finger family protein [Striga asiatica]
MKPGQAYACAVDVGCVMGFDSPPYLLRHRHACSRSFQKRRRASHRVELKRCCDYKAFATHCDTNCPEGPKPHLFVQQEEQRNLQNTSSNMKRKSAHCGSSEC